ncbi:MAG TPA: choice-of-anchor D domain-containing protein, partial [Prosthecobacter sp.]|nr:choice-of-anchor D domain-containing protein [Prosthecobacter sp.]
MPRRVLIQPVFSVLAALAFAGVSAGADSFAPVYDLDKLPGTGADAPDTLVVGQALNDNLGNRMTAADVNGDGTPDLIVAAVGRDAPPNVMNAGAVYIWLGKGAQAGIKHASGILGTAPDVSIYGGDADDALASSLAVGDVNGDGLADLVLGAAAADGAGNSKAAAGEVYIIFGRTTFPATLTMKTQGDAGANVTIYGATAQDQLSAGGLHLADFNADGVVDIVMGAPFADGPSESRPESGEAYVVAGRKLPATFPATIDLAVGGAASTVIFGGATADPVGDRITENGALAVGDINNDGAADIILGSNLADGPSEGRSAAGEIYIVPGRGLLLQVVDVLGGGAITVYGATAGDRLTSGGALLVADVNADGVDDVIAGAPFGDGPSDNREDAGEATVILGRQSLPNLLDLAQPVAITIYGPSAGDNLTLDRALAAGDINGDRVKDLVLGAMNADGPAEAANLAGEAYFVFGRTTLSSAVYTLDLAVQGAAGANVTVYGSAAASQLTGDALPGDPMLVIADFTGDAINDVLLPAPLANATHGEVYLVPGRQSFPTTLNLAVQGSAGAEVTFRANNAVNLGSRSLAAGDVNADGVADVLVSPTTTTSSNSGAGYVVFGTAPELSVEEPAGTAVADGDTRDLGSTLLTRSTTRTFTITNTGGGTLRNFKLTMIGSHANQFGITAQPTAPVAAGDSTTFTVRFAPTVAGIRTATLQIASSDLLHSPFDIHLTGTGVTMPIVKTTGITPGSITFDGATVNGTVEAKGTPWDVFFDYGTTTSYGSFVAAEPATASGTGITAVSKVLTGLLPHTRYNYRVRITHAVLGTVTGANMTFLTGNHAPTPVNDSYVVLPGAKVTLDVLANDFDVDGDSMSLLSFKAPLPAKSGTLVKSGNSLIFTASATFTGASFTYVVRDAFGGSAQGTVNLGLGTISLTPPGPMTFPSAGTAYDVDVVSNGAWSVTETLPWVSVDTLSGAGDDTITITLLPNPAKAARTGTVFIGGSAHVITQEGVKMPSIS